MILTDQSTRRLIPFSLQIGKDVLFDQHRDLLLLLALIGVKGICFSKIKHEFQKNHLFLEEKYNILRARCFL